MPSYAYSRSSPPTLSAPAVQRFPNISGLELRHDWKTILVTGCIQGLTTCSPHLPYGPLFFFFSSPPLPPPSLSLHPQPPRSEVQSGDVSLQPGHGKASLSRFSTEDVCVDAGLEVSASLAADSVWRPSLPSSSAGGAGGAGLLDLDVCMYVCTSILSIWKSDARFLQHRPAAPMGDG